MKKITKEICIVFINDYNRSKPIFWIFVSVFALLAIWFFTENVIVLLAAAVLLSALTICAAYIANKRINNVDLSSFYLVEDVIADFHKKGSYDAGGSGKNYVYTFRDYGEYTIHKSAYPTIEIPLHKEKDVDHLSIEKMCIESCEKGDIFYLLIVKEKDRAKIIKCFPKYHFDIEQDDFDYIDGKYYCRKQAAS